MSENIQSIANGTYSIGETNKLTFSAGPGIKIDEPSAGTVRIANDETVLWSGSPASTVTSIALTEPWSGFERIKLFGKSEGGSLYHEIDTDTINTAEHENLSNNGFSDWNSTEYFVYVTLPCSFDSQTAISVNSARYVGYWNGSWQARLLAPNTVNIITKVVGINRKEV